MGLYVGNLHVSTCLVGPVGPCMSATCKSFGACWTELGAWGLYVGNLHVSTWALSATCSWFGACWTQLGASWGLQVGNLQVLWHQARGILGLYVGNPQVLWGLLDRAWGILGCRLATCSFLTRVGPSLRDVRGVCWQPTGLMGPIGPSLEHLGAVSWQPTGLLGPVGPLGCLLAT